ncbi:Xaa-Pro dipeptidase [Ascochyta rabiei]|uniref:Xaa-Pro dipeptidase n=1 Tax=Didymella rabiei TaxID=5454 RepID=UPI00190000F5|nr:Xaa-Pro dipeptidase [Ascochyta rabiei]UPX16723.1 Xaa-Pro dipeptidase [Ascochyta rabiei]
MEALDGMDLAERLSMDAKEYWVHLDADGPLEKYPARQHARRVQEKLGIDEGLIYLAGQPAKNNEDSDMPAPFRQRRYFYYLTGCNEPSCHMTYDIQHDILSLFIPRIDPKRVIWNGRGSTLAEAVERYDIDEVYYVDELGDVIKDWSNYYGGLGNDIYVLHDGQLPRIPGLRAIIDSDSLRPAMNAARMIKDGHEISLIRKANDISSEAHRKVLANILKFKNEAQVEGLFMDVCISHQAKQQAYDPIAASGSNAGTLHYDANNEDFEDRQLMCLDAGCEYGLYASDITRTFPLTESWPSKEARNIYKLVERMQESCIERLAPGVRYLDLHILAHQIAIDGLLKLGILHNGTREEIYKAGTSRAFFPHGLGHHVGLEVHDVGQAELMSVRGGKAVFEQAPSLFPENFHMPVYDLALCHAPTDTQSSQLEEGMVVTVEPGIYFSVYALQQFYLPSPIHSRFINQKVLQGYLPVGGVRIEDDILITSRGYENLTTAPKGDRMFDIIRGVSSVSNTVRRTAAVTPTGASEPHLFRAPGFPLQATPQALRAKDRAATMPCQPKQRHFSDKDRRNTSLGFKRCMTTDERVQHWRESNQRSPPLEVPQLNHGKPVTVCGSFSCDVKHVFIGDSCAFPFQTPGLSHCTNCTILAQTLRRLRENLALAAKSSSLPQKQDPSPILSMPVLCELSPAHETGGTETADNTRKIPDTMPHFKDVRHLTISQIPHDCTPTSDLAPQQSTYPTYLREKAIPQDDINHSLVEELTKQCQNVALGQYVAEPVCMYATDQHTPLNAVTPTVFSKQRHAALESQVTTIIRDRSTQQREQRRASNHTDDRDWLA